MGQTPWSYRLGVHWGRIYPTVWKYWFRPGGFFFWSGIRFSLYPAQAWPDWSWSGWSDRRKSIYAVFHRVQGVSKRKTFWPEPVGLFQETFSWRSDEQDHWEDVHQKGRRQRSSRWQHHFWWHSHWCTWPGTEKSNRGTLIIDASCAPADIAYPTDLELCDRARRWVEIILDHYWRNHGSVNGKS